jgi:hypothetical protein
MRVKSSTAVGMATDTTVAFSGQFNKTREPMELKSNMETVVSMLEKVLVDCILPMVILFPIIGASPFLWAILAGAGMTLGIVEIAVMVYTSNNAIKEREAIFTTNGKKNIDKVKIAKGKIIFEQRRDKLGRKIINFIGAEKQYNSTDEKRKDVKEKVRRIRDGKVFSRREWNQLVSTRTHQEAIIDLARTKLAKDPQAQNDKEIFEALKKDITFLEKSENENNENNEKVTMVTENFRQEQGDLRKYRSKKNISIIGLRAAIITGFVIAEGLMGGYMVVTMKAAASVLSFGFPVIVGTIVGTLLAALTMAAINALLDVTRASFSINYNQKQLSILVRELRIKRMDKNRDCLPFIQAVEQAGKGGAGIKKCEMAWNTLRNSNIEGRSALPEFVRMRFRHRFKGLLGVNMKRFLVLGFSAVAILVFGLSGVGAFIIAALSVVASETKWNKYMKSAMAGVVVAAIFMIALPGVPVLATLVGLTTATGMRVGMLFGLNIQTIRLQNTKSTSSLSSQNPNMDMKNPLYSHRDVTDKERLRGEAAGGFRRVSVDSSSSSDSGSGSDSDDPDSDDVSVLEEFNDMKAADGPGPNSPGSPRIISEFGSIIGAAASPRRGQKRVGYQLRKVNKVRNGTNHVAAAAAAAAADVGELAASVAGSRPASLLRKAPSSAANTAELMPGSSPGSKRDK